jgi:hypothetical protein
MVNGQIQKLLAYFSASFGFLSALGGAFILGIAFVTAGQRAPYGAGFTCLSSACVLLIVAASLFRKVAAAKLAIATPGC